MIVLIRHSHPVALVVACLASATLTTTGQERAPEKDSIIADELRRDVIELTSDEMGGRLVGTSGNRMAAEFIARRFEALNLTPAGNEGDYFHRFDLVTVKLGQPNNLSALIEGTEFQASLGGDFFPEPFSGTGQAGGTIVFVGFGISAPTLGHDDYGTVNVNNKVVVMLDHEPGETDEDSMFDGLLSTEHARSVRKALEAQSRGAAAVLFVSDLHNHSSTRSVKTRMERVWPSDKITPSASSRIPRYQLGAWVNELHIPVVRISINLAEKIFADGKQSLVELSRAAEKNGGISPVERNDRFIEVTTSIDRKLFPEKNVVGLIEGTDPDMRDEWIIICAHYDHEGDTSSGLFRGADDDASGIAGLLEIAQAYSRASRTEGPRRSILFAAWNAEERGLLGSWSYTVNPLQDLNSTVAVINLDMIGRHEEIPVNAGFRFQGLQPQTANSNINAVNLLGYSYSTDLRLTAQAANYETGLELRFRYDDNRSNLIRRSDHWPFLFNRVPSMFVHTGLHPDYHTERDEADKLDYEKMTRIVRLVHQLSWNLAQAVGRPAFN